MHPHIRILLPSDVFPPRCGGAGWSAHALAQALITRGHAVQAVVPQEGARGIATETVGGVPTLRYGYRTISVPFVKNYLRYEALWPRLAAQLTRTATDWAPAGGTVLIHAQHVQTAQAAVLAGRRLGAPVVVTVRDHWPWHYFSTGLHGDRLPYARKGRAALATDLIGRLGPLSGVAALPAILYMQTHLRRRQQILQQADAVVAVSTYIAHRLNGLVAPERMHVIPNLVDSAAIEQTIATPPRHAPAQPYVLFVGKLERNKGAQLLVDIFRALVSHSPTLPPLLVAGNGPLREEIEQGMQPIGVQTRFLDWIDHHETLRLMAHCQLLLFPSAWGEPLSRVLLEASACGAPILAMPTGGTTDIITDGVNGALERTPERFALRMAALLERPEQRRALGVAAQRHAKHRFGADYVGARVEALYRSLL